MLVAGHKLNPGDRHEENDMMRSTRDFPVSPQALAIALALAAGTGSAPGAPKVNGDRQKALRVVGLGLLFHIVRSRRFYERAAIAAVLAAAVTGLAGLDKESRAKSFARMVAWLKQADDRIEEKVKDALT
jgi:hypothetical protein